MRLSGTKWLLSLVLFFFINHTLLADDIEIKNAKKWSFSGRVQMQHLYDSNTDADAGRTNQGFRMRRVRLQTSVNMTDFVSGKIQFDIRDNVPVLKDAEGEIKLFGEGYFRFGQFKVPVWREEFKRSSGKLLLVERSAVAGFLDGMLLSARHVGVEIGGDLGKKAEFAINYSNGAGEGERETAGSSKSDDINNGKMFAGRLDVELSDAIEIGISAVSNTLGNEIAVDSLDNTGAVTAIAPDFGFYLKDAGLDIEGGAVFGSVSKDFIGTADNTSFMLLDFTGRWMKKLASANENFGGMNGIGFAAGFSFIDPNGDVEKDEASYVRFGPEFYFGKNTRIQLNGEIEMPAAEGADSIFKIRSQFTVNL